MSLKRFRWMDRFWWQYRWWWFPWCWLFGHALTAPYDASGWCVHCRIDESELKAAGEAVMAKKPDRERELELEKHFLWIAGLLVGNMLLVKLTLDLCELWGKK